MDPQQQDEQFFQMLEAAYNSIIENHTHPEESIKTPPDFDYVWGDIQTPPVNFLDMPPFPEPALTYQEPYTPVLTFGEIMSQSLQLSQRAMGLAINSALFQASVGSLRRGLLSGSHAPEGAEGEEQAPANNNSNSNHHGGTGGTNTSAGAFTGANPCTTGASTATAPPLPATAIAPTQDPCAVDLDSVSRLLADSYTDTYADVEVMLGCYRLIGKITGELGDGAIDKEEKEEEEEEEEEYNWEGLVGIEGD